MTNEERTASLAGAITCTRCGHVTPPLQGWMLNAVMHHLVAVHGGRMSLLKRRGRGFSRG